MNDGAMPDQTEAAPSTLPAANALTAGTILRNAREAAGLHVAALAVSMRVPVKKLEALEADRLDLLPDAVFVRALASSVCRALKIDAAPVLERLPQSSVPRLNLDERGINAPFHLPGESTGRSIPAIFAKPRVLVVLVLVIGALVLTFFPDVQRSDAPAEVVQLKDKAPAEPAPVSVPVPPSGVAAEVAPPVTAPPAAVVPVAVVAQNPPAPVPAPALLPAAVPVQSAAPVAASDSKRVESSSSATGVLVLKARGPSWVQVSDAKGVVLLSRILTAGEVLGTSGALPLSVVIGRADVTDVEIRGKVFNLEGIARENVARFEVK
ncbi:MAG: helix-turn-helix domain-containing protein [Rhodoferax sp.]